VHLSGQPVDEGNLRLSNESDDLVCAQRAFPFEAVSLDVDRRVVQEAVSLEVLLEVQFEQLREGPQFLFAGGQQVWVLVHAQVRLAEELRVRVVEQQQPRHQVLTYEFQFFR